MHKHRDRCTGLDSKEETLSYLAHQGWYDIDFLTVFNLLSATHTWWNMHRAHHSYLHHCQEEPFFHPIFKQVHHLRETHVHSMCRSIKLTSGSDALVDFGIPNFRQWFRTEIEDDWGYKVNGLVLRYDQNVFIDSIVIKLQNRLFYYRQPFHLPTSVEHLGLNCQVEYTNANQRIMPEYHNISIRYMDCDLKSTFQCRVPSVPVVYFNWILPNPILQFQECLTAENLILTFSERFMKTQHWILRPQPQEYVVGIPKKYKDLHGWAGCVDGFIQVLKQTDKMHIVPVRAIVGPANWVCENNAASDRMDSIWLIYNLVDIDTYWTVH